MTCTAVRDKNCCFVGELLEEEVWEVASPNVSHWARMEVWNNEPDILLVFAAEEEGGNRNRYKLTDFVEVVFHVV